MASQAVLAVVFLALLAVCAGNTVTWSGGASGSFHQATNWNPNGIPQLTDSVLIANNATITIDAPVSVYSIAITAGGAQLLNTGGFSVTVAQGFTAGHGLTRLNGAGTLVFVGAQNAVPVFGGQFAAVNWNISLCNGTTLQSLQIGSGSYSISSSGMLISRTVNTLTNALFTVAGNLLLNHGGSIAFSGSSVTLCSTSANALSLSSSTLSLACNSSAATLTLIQTTLTSIGHSLTFTSALTVSGANFVGAGSLIAKGSAVNYVGTCCASSTFSSGWTLIVPTASALTISGSYANMLGTGHFIVRGQLNVNADIVVHSSFDCSGGVTIPQTGGLNLQNGAVHITGNLNLAPFFGLAIMSIYQTTLTGCPTANAGAGMLELVSSTMQLDAGCTFPISSLNLHSGSIVQGAAGLVIKLASLLSDSSSFVGNGTIMGGLSSTMSFAGQSGGDTQFGAGWTMIVPVGCQLGISGTTKLIGQGSLILQGSLFATASIGLYLPLFATGTINIDSGSTVTLNKDSRIDGHVNFLYTPGNRLAVVNAALSGCPSFGGDSSSTLSLTGATFNIDAGCQFNSTVLAATSSTVNAGVGAQLLQTTQLTVIGANFRGSNVTFTTSTGTPAFDFVVGNTNQIDWDFVVPPQSTVHISGGSGTLAGKGSLLLQGTLSTNSPTTFAQPLLVTQSGSLIVTGSNTKPVIAGAAHILGNLVINAASSSLQFLNAELTGCPQVSGLGLFRLTSSTMQLDSPCMQLNTFQFEADSSTIAGSLGFLLNVSSAITFSGATFSGYGSIQLSGASVSVATACCASTLGSDWSIIVPKQAGLRVVSATNQHLLGTAAIVNYGSFALQSTLFTTYSILNYGSLSFPSVAALFGSTITNAGSFSLGANSIVSASVSFVQTGGSTMLPASASLLAPSVSIQGGVLSGAGTITGDLIVEVGGTVQPTGGASQSLYIDGNYVQYGQLDLSVSQSAALGGWLEVTGGCLTKGAVNVTDFATASQLSLSFITAPAIVGCLDTVTTGFCIEYLNTSLAIQHGLSCPHVCTSTGLSCPSLPPIVHGSISRTNGNTFPSTATYSCDPGYALNATATRTCTAQATWTGAAPWCNGILCDTLAAPINGSVQTSNGNHYPSTATFACNSPLLPTANSATCQPNGQWSPSLVLCTPPGTVCDVLPSPANGHVSTTHSNTYPSTATYTCNAPYTPSATTRTCQSDGHWTGSPVTCEGLCDPSSPPAVANAFTVSANSTTVVYACSQGYHSSGVLLGECDSSGNYNVVGSCVETSVNAAPTCAPVATAFVAALIAAVLLVRGN